MNLLDFEKEIFEEAFQNDGLLIMAKGLGLERILISMVKLYCEPTNLVLVLNANVKDEEYIMDLLKENGCKYMPKSINSDISVQDRISVYMNGGVIFITNRILVVDLLVNRIPSHLVTGILVFRAHKVIDSCQESFILRLYREKNKTGFIKAFSDSPASFTRGFCLLDRTLKSLFLKNIFLWPRFRDAVVACCDRNKIEVIELHIPMSALMKECQTALLDIISACIKELKLNSQISNMEQINIENATLNSFDRILRHHLDPIWHQLSPKVRQIVADLKTMRELLLSLSQHDCFHFNRLVTALRSNEEVFKSNSGWLFTESAERLIEFAKQRTNKVINDESGLVLEECPKLLVLQEVLQEIRDDLKSSTADIQTSSKTKDNNLELGAELASGLVTEIKAVPKVFIAAQDEQTCDLISKFLCNAPRMNPKNTAIPSSQKSASGKEEETKAKHSKSNHKGTRLKVRKGAKNINRETIDTGTLSSEDNDAINHNALPDHEKTNMDKDLDDNNLDLVTIIHPMYGADDPYKLRRIVDEIAPEFVIFYDANVMLVRQLEVFKASNPNLQLRAYFLIYSNSIEEQRYLTTLSNEQKAFEYLIQEKSTMVIPEEREGRDLIPRDLGKSAAVVGNNDITRVGGTQAELTGDSTKNLIIVDMREFRSELPSLLHRRGIDVQPVTIQVGDYILTPDICVERKSVSDLIGSLHNGRLYTQCVSMCRTYKKAILLIEFDPSRPFLLQDRSTKAGEIASHDIISRLVLLTLHFPRLFIIWSQGPFVTAELFEHIKENREQPSAEVAMAITGSDPEANTNITGQYNPAPYDMLLKLPGITHKNCHLILRKVKNIHELSVLNLDQLKLLLGNEQQAQQLYDFMTLNSKSQAYIDSVHAKADVKRKIPASKKKNMFKDV